MSETTENEIEAKVINRLKKTIIIKKELSEKQQAHLDKLAVKKQGKKYTEKVKEEDIKDIPVEIKAKKVKKEVVKDIPVEIKVKKVKKVVEVIESSEESSSEEEEIVVKKKVVKKIPKKVVKKLPTKQPEIKQESQYYSIC